MTGPRGASTLTFAMASLTFVACSEVANEPTSWTQPLDDNAETIVLPPRAANSTAVIELVPDLVIQSDSAPGAPLGDVMRIAVDSSGRLFVFDVMNARIVVYGPTGEPERTIGGEQGQGPGAFDSRGTIAVAGERIYYVSPGRLSVWSLEGEHLSTRRVDQPNFFVEITGLSDGTAVGAYRDYSDASAHVSFQRIGPTAETVARLATFRQPDPLRVTRADAPTEPAFIPAAFPSMAVARSGTVYVTPGDPYEVYAYEATGRMRWALKRRGEPRMLTRAQRTSTIELIRRRVPDATDSDIAWPETLPALDDPRSGLGPPIATDGKGNVYVFPLTRLLSETIGRELGPDDLARDVDVFSPTGRLLFSGRITRVNWLASHDRYLYGTRHTMGTASREIVRYRLVAPYMR